jgi:hypothetical protein
MTNRTYSLSAAQDPADGGLADPMAEATQFALDAYHAPSPFIARHGEESRLTTMEPLPEPQHQRLQLRPPHPDLLDILHYRRDLHNDESGYCVTSRGNPNRRGRSRARTTIAAGPLTSTNTDPLPEY